MTQADRSSVIYVAAGVIQMIPGLSISYLRMKRHAAKAEKRFYRSLIESGMEKRMARELSSDFTDLTKLSFWMKGAAPFGRTNRPSRK